MFIYYLIENFFVFFVFLFFSNDYIHHFYFLFRFFVFFVFLFVFLCFFQMIIYIIFINFFISFFIFSCIYYFNHHKKQALFIHSLHNHNTYMYILYILFCFCINIFLYILNRHYSFTHIIIHHCDAFSLLCFLL